MLKPPKPPRPVDPNVAPNPVAAAPVPVPRPVENPKPLFCVLLKRPPEKAHEWQSIYILIFKVWKKINSNQHSFFQTESDWNSDSYMFVLFQFNKLKKINKTNLNVFAQKNILIQKLTDYKM